MPSEGQNQTVTKNFEFETGYVPELSQITNGTRVSLGTYLYLFENWEYLIDILKVLSSKQWISHSYVVGVLLNDPRVDILSGNLNQEDINVVAIPLYFT